FLCAKRKDVLESRGFANKMQRMLPSASVFRRTGQMLHGLGKTRRFLPCAESRPRPGTFPALLLNRCTFQEALRRSFGTCLEHSRRQSRHHPTGAKCVGTSLTS